MTYFPFAQYNEQKEGFTLENEQLLFAGAVFFCALLFLGVAFFAARKKTPMHFGFGSTVDPARIRNIAAYNKASAVMWGVLGLCYGLLGLLILFDMALGGLVTVFFSIVGVIALVAVHGRIYQRYKIGEDPPWGGQK